MTNRDIYAQFGIELPALEPPFHRSPLWLAEEGRGCDCCARRMVCGRCGARFLSRGPYANYRDHRSLDEDGYARWSGGAGGDLVLGPCCGVPEKAPTVHLEGCPAEAGSACDGSAGCEWIGVRVWVPEVFPTGPAPWATDAGVVEASVRQAQSYAAWLRNRARKTRP